jgi:tRNA G18 (ribose-2'-O)-methylase SpoU
VFTRQEITSLDAPELAPFRNMRAQFDHLRGGVFVAEGEKVVRRLLESPLEVRAVLLPPKWVTDFEPLLDRRPETITLFVADKELLMELTGFSMYQGLLGLGSVPPASDLPALLRQNGPRLWVAVDGLSNAENVGAVVRNAAALGAQAIIAGETSAHPYLRRAVRASMGTIFALPYLVTRNLADELRAFGNAGVRCIAAHPRGRSGSCFEADLRGDVCLVFGAEGEGLRPDVRAACALEVEIPMAGAVDSLNVAAASAVLCAETLRQRGFVPSGWQNR